MATALDLGGWIPDGGFVLSIRVQSGPTPAGIMTRRSDGQLSPFRTAADGSIFDVRLSSDGQHIAYTSRETGQQEVFVDSFPSPGAHAVQVSHGGGGYPRWRADGRELFFTVGGRLMVAPVSPGTSVSVGNASALFTLPSARYAVHPDGERFLVLVPTTPASSTVRMTLNLPSRRAARSIE